MGVRILRYEGKRVSYNKLHFKAPDHVIRGTYKVQLKCCSLPSYLLCQFRITFQIESTANRCRAENTCAIFALLLTFFWRFSLKGFVGDAGIEPASLHRAHSVMFHPWLLAAQVYRLRLHRLFAVKILNTMKNQLLFYYRPIGDIIIIIFHNQTSMITISGAICLIASSCSSITLFLYSSIASFAPADTKERDTSLPSTSA